MNTGPELLKLWLIHFLHFNKVDYSSKQYLLLVNKSVKLEGYVSVLPSLWAIELVLLCSVISVGINPGGVVGI